MIVCILISVALFVGFYFAERADARVSEEGFKRKYQEGNELITWIFRTQTPSEIQLSIFNWSQLIVFVIPGAFIPWPGTLGWTWAVTAAAIGKHLLAVRKWRRAFATGGKSLFDSKTAWQKFLGL